MRFGFVFTLLWGILPAHAATIYVTASGNASFDSNLQSALQAFGHSVTLGVNYQSFDGTQSLAGFDAVYLQVNYIWMVDMSAGGQTELVNFVNSGGGLVTTEWLVWSTAGGTRFTTLNPILPVDPTPYFDSLTPVTFNQDVPDPALNAGLGASFTMSLENIGGTRTCFTTARTGASSFYTMDGGYIGLAGWDVGSGHVLSFATTNGQAQLDDPDFQRLLSNSMDWASGAPSAVPEPGALTLILSGAGLLLLRRALWQAAKPRPAGRQGKSPGDSEFLSGAKARLHPGAYAES